MLILEADDFVCRIRRDESENFMQVSCLAPIYQIDSTSTVTGDALRKKALPAIIDLTHTRISAG